MLDTRDTLSLGTWAAEMRAAAGIPAAHAPRAEMPTPSTPSAADVDLLTLAACHQAVRRADLSSADDVLTATAEEVARLGDLADTVEVLAIEGDETTQALLFSPTSWSVVGAGAAVYPRHLLLVEFDPSDQASRRRMVEALRVAIGG